MRVEYINPFVETSYRVLKEVLGDAADIIVCNIASEENRQKAIGLGIMAVPTIAINDEVAFVGAPALDELVNKVKSLI